MRNPKVYGSFIKRGNYTYRTSAYIQWGSSEKSIGACLLLNPGAGVLADSLMTLLNKEGSVSGWIKAEDPTMDQLIKVVEKIYERQSKIEGRFYIYNHFNLQNTSDRSAISQIEELIEAGEYDINESLVPVEELRKHPWLLLGWGVMQNRNGNNLKLIKKKWRDLIRQSNIPAFGKKHPSKDEYYHVCPRIPTQRQDMINDLVSIYKKMEKEKGNKRYTFLKWNKEYFDDAKFIVQDNHTMKQSVFIPGRCQDLIWFKSDLANDQAVSDWDDFGEESVDDLEPIAF